MRRPLRWLLAGLLYSLADRVAPPIPDDAGRDARIKAWRDGSPSRRPRRWHGASPVSGGGNGEAYGTRRPGRRWRPPRNTDHHKEAKQ